MTTRIEVDFNSRDDAGHVPAPMADADGPLRVGDMVEAYDDAGYRCFAIASSVAGASVSLDPLWQTFAAPNESRLVRVTTPPGLWSIWKNGLTVTLSLTTSRQPAKSTTGREPVPA